MHADHQRRFPAAVGQLLDGEIEVLCSIYTVINIPLDEYLLREELPQRLRDAFAAKTGRLATPATLIAAMMAHRKRGLLPCLEEEKAASKTAQPFSDIEEVARQQRRAASE